MPIKLELRSRDKLRLISPADAHLLRAQHPYRALLARYTRCESASRSRSACDAGYYSTLDISAPPGSVVGPVPPAAIGCRSISAGAGDVIAGPRQAFRTGAAGVDAYLTFCPGTIRRTGNTLSTMKSLRAAGAPVRSAMASRRSRPARVFEPPVEALEKRILFRVERTHCGTAGRRGDRGGRGFCAITHARDRYRGEGRPSAGMSPRSVQKADKQARGAFRVDSRDSDERRSLRRQLSKLPRSCDLRVCTPSGGGTEGQPRRNNRCD